MAFLSVSYSLHASVDIEVVSLTLAAENNAGMSRECRDLRHPDFPPSRRGLLVVMAPQVHT